MLGGLAARDVVGLLQAAVAVHPPVCQDALELLYAQLVVVHVFLIDLDGCGKILEQSRGAIERKRAGGEDDDGSLGRAVVARQHRGAVSLGLLPSEFRATHPGLGQTIDSHSTCIIYIPQEGQMQQSWSVWSIHSHAAGRESYNRQHLQQ